MTSSDTELVKRREVWFRGPHPDPHQARTAAVVLSELHGVVHVQAVSPVLAHVHYDVTILTLQIIEQTLQDVGLHLDNSLLVKLKRALYAYTEEAQRDSLGCRKGQTNCTQRVFVTHYQNRPHGCRDERPEHWRRYL
ncbi:MAG: hypothetical protein P8180_16570 [Gammaproteobacteria bacterium]